MLDLKKYDEKAHDCGTVIKRRYVFLHTFSVCVAVFQGKRKLRWHKLGYFTVEIGKRRAKNLLR